MTDEELEAVVESTDDTVALAGQAVRMTDKTKLMASKELISRIKNKAPIINPKISLSTYLDTNIVIKEARADITKVSVHYDMPSKSAEMITPEMTLQMLNSMIDSGAFGNGLVGKICCAEIDDLGEVCTEC